MYEEIIYQDEEITVTVDDIEEAAYHCDECNEIWDYIQAQIGISDIALSKASRKRLEEFEDIMEDYLINNTKEIWEKFNTSILKYLKDKNNE